MPITEYLPEDHEGRQVYGLISDPTPDKGQALRYKASHHGNFTAEPDNARAMAESKQASTP